MPGMSQKVLYSAIAWGTKVRVVRSTCWNTRKQARSSYLSLNPRTGLKGRLLFGGCWFPATESYSLKALLQPSSMSFSVLDTARTKTPQLSSGRNWVSESG